MVRFERLNELLLSLTPNEFEELCYILVKSMGFFNLEWIKGGRDRGRDIKAQLESVEPDGHKTIETWFFQCKLYSSGIGVDNITSSIEWTIAEKIPYWVIISNSYLTTDAKEFVEKKEEQLALKIRQWTDKDLQDKLIERPHIIYSYFSDENIVDPKIIFDLKRIVDIEIKAPKHISEGIVTEVNKLDKISGTERTIKILEVIDIKSLVNGSVDANLKAIIYQNFANICYYSGALEEALKYLDKSLAITPKNKNVLNTKAIIFERLRKYDKSIEICEESLKIDEKDKVALNLMAHNSHQIGKNKGALKYLDDAITIDPEFILARDNKGKILQSEGLYLESLLYFLETLRIKSNSKTTIVAISDLFASIMAYDKALEIVGKAIEIDPSFDNAWNTKGHIISNKSHYTKTQEERIRLNEESLKCFNKVISLNPFNILGWSNKGIILSLLGKYDDAIEATNKSIELDSRNILCLNAKAIILMNKDEDEEASRIVEQALKINNRSIDNKKLYLTKAKILIKKKTKGAYKKALKSVEDSLNYDKNFIDGWMLKGNILNSLERKKHAEKCYEKAKEIQKDYEKVYNSLIKKFNIPSF